MLNSKGLQSKISISVDTFYCSFPESNIAIIKRDFETKFIPNNKRKYYFNQQKQTTMETKAIYEFKNEKCIFHEAYEGKFDTPKKLNRSNKQIPDWFVEKIEAGQATSKDIQEISKSFPVFIYKTCLTIHGEFPKIKIEQIGYYKNIIQNQNNSLEIRWSAIDQEIKSKIGLLISICSENWRSSSNSMYGEFYEKSVSFDDETKAIEYIKQQKQLIDKLNFENCFFKKHVSGFKFMGKYYIFTTIIPISVNIDPIIIASKITELPKEEIQKKYDDYIEEQERKHLEEKRRREIIQENINKCQKQIKEITKNLVPCKIEPIIGNIYFEVKISKKYTPLFALYKIVKKGTFGRYIVQKAIVLSLDEEPIFKEFNNGKQIDLNKITIGKIYKYHAKQKSNPKEQIEQLRKKIEELEKQSENVNETVKKLNEGIKEVKKDIDLLIVDYSEKAIAIFGDTKAVKEQLKQIGAKFNPYLNKNGTKTTGWILPKSKKELLQTFLN